MLDLTKPVQTRLGDPVRVLATDVRDRHPVVAVVTDRNGSESVETYYLNGRYLDTTTSSMDLVNIAASSTPARELEAV